MQYFHLPLIILDLMIGKTDFLIIKEFLSIISLLT